MQQLQPCVKIETCEKLRKSEVFKGFWSVRAAGFEPETQRCKVLVSKGSCSGCSPVPWRCQIRHLAGLCRRPKRARSPNQPASIPKAD